MEAHGITVRETVDARKTRYDDGDFDELFDGATKIVAARGKKHVVFDLKKDPPEPSELAKRLLGPSGNLRAPAAKVGKTWLVGFSDDAWSDVFKV